MPLSEAVELFKDWHQFDPAGVMDINIPEPKGKLRLRGYLKRLDYLSDKWNQYEDVYYYHHFRKNFPALYEDEKGNYFIYGFIRVTKRGIDDWKTVNNLVWKRPDAKKGVAKLGVLQLMSFEAIDTGKTETLMFDDRYYVGHPDLDFTYISSPVRANPSAPPLAVQHLLSVVENIKKDKKAMKALDRALTYHRKQMKSRARANMSALPATVMTKMMTSQAFLKSIVTEVSTATFGVGIIATILGGLLVDWLVSTARNKAIPPQMPMPSAWVTRMTKSYVDAGIKDPKDIQTRLEEIWSHLDFDAKREAYERDYKWPGKEKLQVTENPKKFTEFQLVQKAYEITFRWAYAGKIHSSAEAFSFFRKRGINVSFTAIGSAFDSGKMKRIKEEQAKENPEDPESIYDEVGGCMECPYKKECIEISDLAGYTMDDEYGTCPPEIVTRHRAQRENPDPAKCPKCGAEGWLDVSGKYECVKCGHTFKDERDPLASRFNPEGTKIFVYGSLRTGGFNAFRIHDAHPRFPGNIKTETGTIKGELRVSDTSSTPLPFIIAKGEGIVVGELLTFDERFTPENLEDMDRFETGWKRTEAKVTLADGRKEKAWVYEILHADTDEWRKWWNNKIIVPDGDYIEYVKKKRRSNPQANPIRSKAQWRLFKARYPEMFNDWQRHAPVNYQDLPERAEENPLTYQDYKEAVEGEGWAIGDYAGMIAEADTEHEKKVLKHIRDEEKEHLDELVELMDCEKAPPKKKNPVETVLGDGPGEGR